RDDSRTTSTNSSAASTQRCLSHVRSTRRSPESSRRTALPNPRPSPSAPARSSEWRHSSSVCPVGTSVADSALPIRMLHDRILLAPGREYCERPSSAGVVMPATASMGRRLAWGTVVAAGPHVRQAGLGDTVLYEPAELAEVELEGQVYVRLRERDIHAISE